MNKLLNLVKYVFVMTMVFGLTVSSFVPHVSAAQIANLSALDKARVSFTFDDGFQSTYTLAAPILESHNIDGVAYITTGAIDGTITLDDNQPAMNWEQVVSLQNDYGWEIGAHTVDHAELPTVTQAQIAAEMDQSNAALRANGLTLTNFATPFGAYDNVVVTEALKRYNTHRGFQDRDNLNSMAYNRAILMVQSVESVTTTAQVQAWVDQAIANKQWLILVLHDVAAAQNPNYEYTTTTADLTTMANYVQTKVTAGQIEVVTVEQGSSVPGLNVLQNAAFAQGMDTWTTDNATQMALDSANNGAYSATADNTNSVKVTGGANQAHLFSALTSVDSAKSYIFDTFVNALGLTAGELGFYMDEYDASGNWISGQWLGMVTNGTIGFFTKLYNTTSNLVAQVRVQTYLTANSAGTAYLDNVNLHDIDATPSAIPTVTAGPTATPSATNLMTNGNFNTGSTNWTNDNAAQVSVANGEATMNGGTGAAHLFYNMLSIDPTAQYLFSVLANATGLTTGEAGFYMDEYNAAGQWISGQWFGKVTNGVTSTFEHIYKATSNAVAQVRVQTYLTANATGNVKTDNYSLVNNAASVSATPTATPSGTVTPPASESGNLIANGDFANGLSNGWTTDSTNVVAQAQAVLMQASANAAHLFYGLLPVDSAAQYLFSAVADTTNLTAGELGFYMDEYDANGNWISGQWLGNVANGVVNTFSHAYKATTSTVKQVRVQTYLTANSAGSATVDNYSMTNQNAATPTPTVSGAPTGTPSATPTPGAGLVANNSFETLVSNWASNWTRDGANVAIDTASNGNDGTNSLHITPDAAYGHAFSSLISVNPTTTYTWSQYIKTVAAGGEFGFYIDEYDAAGNWISGQWKGMLNAAYTGAMTFPYTPSSANVAQVRLQYYVVPSSTFDLYLDSVTLTSN